MFREAAGFRQLCKICSCWRGMRMWQLLQPSRQGTLGPTLAPWGQAPGSRLLYDLQILSVFNSFQSTQSLSCCCVSCRPFVYIASFQLCLHVSILPSLCLWLVPWSILAALGWGAAALALSTLLYLWSPRIVLGCYNSPVSPGTADPSPLEKGTPHLPLCP